MLTVIVIAIIIGLIPGLIAHGKGRSFVAWWFYGAAIFIVALPHSIMLKTDRKVVDAKALDAGDVKKCPYYAELIKSEAIVCRFCGRDQPLEVVQEAVDTNDPLERGITFNGAQYIYKGYKYDKLEDALAYAKKYD